MIHVAKEYTPQQEHRMLAIARQTIVDVLSGRDPANPRVDAATETYLVVPRGCFVTLRHRHGRLRGCIGTFERKEPLWMTLMSIAASVTRDPRIVRTNPVVLAEANDLVIEISVLTPMRRIDDPMRMRLGIDGICIQCPGDPAIGNGVFLPQVPIEQGWDVERTLNEVCQMKMGLPADAWRHRKDLEFYLFESIKFAETPTDVMR
ncbi:MAG: AmmeMemoRadiSam system protein A [Planctomycetes bacterium]|nr:AmmeMemoRadiSam system protein A [Planctomycetota bacterium]